MATAEKEKGPARFKGKPQFPASLAELNKAYLKLRSRPGDLFDLAGKRIDGYLGKRDNFKTGDGREWRGYEFKREAATFIIAHSEQKDDPSVAIYLSKGEAEDYTAHILVAQFCLSLASLPANASQKTSLK